MSVISVYKMSNWSKCISQQNHSHRCSVSARPGREGQVVLVDVFGEPKAWQGGPGGPCWCVWWAHGLVGRAKWSLLMCLVSPQLGREGQVVLVDVFGEPPSWQRGPGGPWWGWWGLKYLACMGKIPVDNWYEVSIWDVTFDLVPKVKVTLKEIIVSLNSPVATYLC